MQRAAAVLIGIALAAPVGGFAYPEGAPWGAANPAAQESCASCHFDSDAVDPSAAISLIGLPQRPVAGETYPLELTVDAPMSVVAGFQMLAVSDNSEAGHFVFSDAALEAIGTAIRSTSVQREQPATWSFQWQAPDDELQWPIVLLVAATAGNDDGSPLGDVVHFRSFELEPKTDEQHAR